MFAMCIVVGLITTRHKRSQNWLSGRPQTGRIGRLAAPNLTKIGRLGKPQLTKIGRLGGPQLTNIGRLRAPKLTKIGRLGGPKLTKIANLGAPKLIKFAVSAPPLEPFLSLPTISRQSTFPPPDGVAVTFRNREPSCTPL